MHRLILDFLARRWWIIAVIAAFAVLGIATGQAMAFTPFALVGLLFDAQRGLLRTVRPLPISRRAQAGAWWFIGVLLVPLVTLIAHPVGALIFESTHTPKMIPVPTPDAVLPYAFVLAPDYFAPWFVAAVAAWVGLGYAALCFLLCIALPTRPPNKAIETTWQMFISALWGLSMSGPMFFMFILPKNPGMVTPLHWIVFALVPVAVVLSFIAAPGMANRRMYVITAARTPLATPTGRERGGLTGIPLLLTTVIGRTIALLIFIGAMQMLLTRLIGRGNPEHRDPIFANQMVAFAIIFGAIASEGLGMRVLRVLPLSTAKLAALLLFIPVAIGVGCAAFITVAGEAVDPSLAGLNFLACASAIAGMSALALAASLHIASGARIVVLALFAILSGIAFLFFAKIAIWLLLGGPPGLAIAYLMLVRGLRKSNAFYQPRRCFGVSFGQPLAVR